MLAKTRTPRIMPTTKPAPLTAIATTALDSPFDFAIAPQISPAGPNTIGRTRKARAPRIMPTVERPFPGVDGDGGTNVGIAPGVGGEYEPPD